MHLWMIMRGWIEMGRLFSTLGSMLFPLDHLLSGGMSTVGFAAGEVEQARNSNAQQMAYVSTDGDVKQCRPDNDIDFLTDDFDVLCTGTEKRSDLFDELSGKDFFSSIVLCHPLARSILPIEKVGSVVSDARI